MMNLFPVTPNLSLPAKREQNDACTSGRQRRRGEDISQEPIQGVEKSESANAAIAFCGHK